MKGEEELKITKKGFITKQENISDIYEMQQNPIGSGNYGIVKKATHKITKQERAVKIISKTKIKDINRFKQEIEILRSVVISFAL